MSDYYDKQGMFVGETALVTGAASGIGKAAVKSLLERGASVAGLDINAGIAKMFDGEKFLGLCCDVGEEKTICRAVKTTVKTFGSLDMLVLNAGIFPASSRIESLQLSSLRKTMCINVEANVVLMQESYPFLKAAKKNGRVVVLGSQRARAPAQGTVAYSASKAALIQLARVAALEWGKDGIRVNIVNPGRVCDTAVFTEELLQKRSKQYGMTVEQYKRDNILKEEVTSRDVGELIADMCGPLFSKITGAQMPIDGGDVRVI